MTANRYEVSFWSAKNILELLVIVAQPCILKTTELQALKW